MMQQMNETESFLNSINLGFIEGLYVGFLRDPSLVPSDWRQYFEKFFKEEGDDVEKSRCG